MSSSCVQAEYANCLSCGNHCRSRSLGAGEPERWRENTKNTASRFPTFQTFASKLFLPAVKRGVTKLGFLLMTAFAARAVDRSPISVIRATFYQPLTNINVSFSGAVGASAAERANYRLIARDGTRIPATRVGNVGASSTNMPVYWDGLALPGNFKSIEVADVTDVYDPPGTISPNPARLPIERYVVFGSPEDGTPIAEDVELRAHPSYADTPMGLNITIHVDADPDYPTAMRQALLRFPLPTGGDLAPIPAGVMIAKARLVLLPTMDGVGVPSEYSLHRMLVPWNETNATWNSMVNGVATNNVEAVALPDLVFTPMVTVPSALNVPVTAQVLDWMRGRTPNYGWLLQPRTVFQLQFYSAQYVPSLRPKLIVFYVAPPDLQIERQTDSVRLSWDVPGFHLQQADALSSTDWIETPGGHESPVSVAPTNTARFFRLHGDPQ
jgi:hypothetical protein